MSTPYAQTFAAPTIAARAAGYGIAGEVVDGTDFFAVREAVARAAQRAKAGDGPTLLEANTYRYYGHSKSDKREYRTRDEEDSWRLARLHRPIARRDGNESGRFRGFG